MGWIPKFFPSSHIHPKKVNIWCGGERHLEYFSGDELLRYDERHLELCGEEVDLFPQEKKFLLAVERGDVASTRRLVFSFGLISDLFAIWKDLQYVSYVRSVRLEKIDVTSFSWVMCIIQTGWRLNECTESDLPFGQFCSSCKWSNSYFLPCHHSTFACIIIRQIQKAWQSITLKLPWSWYILFK